MDDKTMMNDVLESVKAELSGYQTAITETENMQLRQTFQQLRDNEESFQYELFKVASAKNFYKPASQADLSQIQSVKNELSN